MLWDSIEKIVRHPLRGHFLNEKKNLGSSDLDRVKDTNGEMEQQDIGEHTLKIVTRGGSPDGNPLEAGIVLEGVEVLGGLSSDENACVGLLGLMCSLNLSYPKPLRYTFEFFQKIELDSAKLSPKILTDVELNLLSC